MRLQSNKNLRKELQLLDTKNRRDNEKCQSPQIQMYYVNCTVPVYSYSEAKSKALADGKHAWIRA